MWEPQPLTTLRASKACRGENFLPFTFTIHTYIHTYIHNSVWINSKIQTWKNNIFLIHWAQRLLAEDSALQLQTPERQRCTLGTTTDRIKIMAFFQYNNNNINVRPAVIRQIRTRPVKFMKFKNIYIIKCCQVHAT
jgi:hypothetical protein